MDDPALRATLVILVTALVCGLAVATRRWQRPTHGRVDLSRLTLPAGLVVFTSTDCSRCKDALTVARASGLPLREITWELEPDKLETAAVTSVPLTLAISPDGSLLAQVSGVPSRRWLKRAATMLDLPST